MPYDTLIVAGGSHYAYVGHDEWSAHAAEVKSLESALTVRRGERLTFVVVGAGPTGVEMAGQIAELARDTLRSDLRSADPGSGRILLIEAADRVLTAFPPSLSKKAERSLRRLSVTPVLASTVGDVDQTGVTIQQTDGTTRRIPARTVVWAAGVTAFGVASALIGRAAAVADIKGLKLSGFLAWITWLVVHLFYLVGFQNRLLVAIRWSISFATRGRGARLITSPANADAAVRPAAYPQPGSSLSMPSSEVSGLAHAMTGARKESVVFVELDTPGRWYTISLEWDRDTGKTQIVLVDIRDASLLVFPVPGANAGDAFRHPFRYAP